MSPMSSRAVALATTLIAAVSGLTSLAPAPAVAADDCSGLSTPIYRVVSPKSSAQLLTQWPAEVQTSQTTYGFSDDRGTLGFGSSANQPGFVPIIRMYNSSTVDFLWATSDAEVSSAQAEGYAKQGTDFYAPTSSSATCAVSVHRFVNGDHTRNAWTAAERANLLAAGWRDWGISFYVKPADTATPISTGAEDAAATGGSDFGVAVIPDTQTETNIASNNVFLNRTNWLVANKDKYDLRYLLHTGDMVNWGWLDPAQYTRAKAAMDVIANAGIPYSLTIGNHDTAAVGWNGVTGSTGYGGSGYIYNPECPIKLGDQCQGWLLVRNTTAFNTTFPVSSLKNVGGVFETGKIDNNWTTFEANNTKWLVLTLELWPRKEAVAWAKNVVATHPTYNVIIQTHNYLNSNGTIGTSNGGYGATAPSYLRDQIVSQYPNVKMVFSGHTGTFTSRTDTYNGNTVASFLGNSLTTNDDPVRILTINPKTGTITSTVYDPIVGKTLNPTNTTISIIH